MSIHSHRLRFKGLNVKSWKGTPEFLRVRMSCSAVKDPTQYLDLGSENYNEGIEFLCVSSMLYVCLQPFQCRISDLRARGCLQPVCCCLLPSCHPPSTGVQELWAAWGSGQCLFGDKVKGNPPASRPWHIINRRTRRGARGRGAKRL